MINILYDMKLMEGEGSGYDLIYEKLTKDGKPLPEIESDFSKMRVSVQSTILVDEVVSILDYINHYFPLTQKERISLGLIAMHKKILSTQLSQLLQLNQEDKLKHWLGSLFDKHIIISRGVKKGTSYLLNPDIFAQSKLGIKPSLKTIEPHKLKALILEDLKYNGKSKMAGIKKRLHEVPGEDIQKTVYEMVESGKLKPAGGKRNRTYALPKKNK